MGSAVTLNEEGEHTLGSRPFHPMYPVYNFSNLTSPSTPQSGPSFGFGSSVAVTSQPPQASTPGSISESGIIHKY